MNAPITPRARAEQAMHDVLVDRTQAIHVAEAVLAEPDAGLDAQAIAWRVLTSAALHRGQLADAASHADRSVELAELAGDDDVLGGALMTRMGVLISDGRAADAIVDAERAEPLLPEPARVRLLIQRATALGLGLGRVDEAIAAYDEIEARDRDLEPIVEAVLTMNRGTQHSIRGDHRRALEDFTRSRERYRELGNAEAESDVLLHQARSAARAGDFPTVFALHAEADERSLFVDGDHRAPNDFADALLAAGLRQEAEQMSRRALELVDGAVVSNASAESALKLAEIRGEFGNLDDALALCRGVRAWADERGNPGVALSASLVELRISLRAERPVDARDVGTVVAQLEAAGRAEESASLRLAGASRAVRAGDVAGGLDLLEPFEGAAPTGGSALEQARWSHAAALRCLATGRAGLAMRHASRGLAAIERLRGGIASMELRAAAVDRAPELARIGIELAADAGRPRSLLRWAERQRAVALRLADEPEPAAVSTDDFASVRTGEHRRHAELESVRSRRARHREIADATSAAVDDVVAAVGARALVEYVVVGDRIDALVVHRGRVRHHAGLVDVAEVRAGVDRLLFGLRRLVDPSPARAAAAADLVAGIGASLDRLLSPIPAGADEIVLVPTGPLHRLPWAALPACHGRSVVLAPSARLWSRPLASDQPSAGVSLVAGPGVPEAVAEIEALHTVYSGVAERISANVEPVRAAIGTGRLVHIAAHGVFRNDNPQFSRLELEDGPLFVHDLDGLASLPRTVVLSACSVGAVGVLDGDEVLGFPAALLARGAASVVAAVVPVEDGAAHDLMIELHRRLQGGDRVSIALAEAAKAVRSRSIRHQAAADSFVVYGRRG